MKKPCKEEAGNNYAVPACTNLRRLARLGSATAKTKWNVCCREPSRKANNSSRREVGTSLCSDIRRLTITGSSVEVKEGSMEKFSFPGKEEVSGGVRE